MADIEVRTNADDAARFFDQMRERVARPGQMLDMLADDLVEFERQAFATRGFGSWSPLDAATIRAKGSSRVLVDTGTLMRDLTSTSAVRVTDDEVTLDTDVAYAGFLQTGTSRMPARPPLPELDDSRASELADHVGRFLVDGVRW